MKFKMFCVAFVCAIGFLLVAAEGKPVYNYPDSIARAEGTDLRIVSYNILAKRWSRNARPAEQRAPDIVQIIHKLSPDFAGLQELDPGWYQLLHDRIKPWKFADKPYDSTMCALIYDSRKYRQLDGGLYRFTNRRIRCLRWGLFEDIQTGKKFMITNTHWDLTVAKRMKNSDLMIKYIAALRKRYPDIPFFCTGDYNCTVDSAEFKKLLKSAGVKDAVQNSPVAENVFVGSHFNPKRQVLVRRRKHIDHVVFYGKIKVVSAKLVVGKLLLTASDHLPIVADFDL